MHITLVISKFWGGAGRVLSVLANSWAESGYEVSLLTFQHDAAETYPVHASVKVRYLGLLEYSSNSFAAVARNLHRLRVLRRAIRESQPDIIVSFLDRTNVLTLLATRGLGRPVVISERTDPVHYDIGSFWKTLRRLVYPLADILVCPTAEGLARFQAMIRVRGVAIPNPIELPASRRDRTISRDSNPVIVAMGRLIPSKGFDMLLDAFSRIAHLHPEWSLTIIGKGPLLAALEEQRRSLKLSGRVHFAGELADPFPVLRAGDLFVFSSRYEGFGMALAEAMACGLPVVSFDCPQGPRFIIRQGVDGVLVPAEDIAALATVLDRLMSDAQERERLAARAPEVITRFGRNHILALWQQLFNELLAIDAVPD